MSATTTKPRRKAAAATKARRKRGQPSRMVLQERERRVAELLSQPLRPVDPGTLWTCTDFFCGGGGSTHGMRSIRGVRVRMAANHSGLAVLVHNKNHENVDHDVADLHEKDPSRYPTTDMAWISPSCTFWSGARGEKWDFTDEATTPTLFDLDNDEDEQDERKALPGELRERSRALMHDVPRFAEHHRYKAIIVENVLPLLRWWYLPKWLARMRKLGYRYKILTLNSGFAHQLGAPAPQLRDRVYIVFWLDKYREPDFDRWTRPQAWCPTCQEPVTALYAPKDPKKPYGAYWQQYYYRCPKSSCRFGIVHPYTLPAVAAINWSIPGQKIGERKRPLADTTMARITDGVRQLHEAEQRGTTLRRVPALLVPAGGTWNDTAWPIDAPMRTRTTRASEGIAMVPLRNNNRSKPGLVPLDTFAAAGNHHGFVALPGAGGPPAAWNPNVLYAYDTGAFRSVTEPLPTQTTVEGDALLQVERLVEDSYFRMLRPEEIKRGMAFPQDYYLEGTQAEQVELCGNAVTPNVARDLTAAVIEAITGEEPQFAAA